jgi:hypothetical protein
VEQIVEQVETGEGEQELEELDELDEPEDSTVVLADASPVAVGVSVGWWVLGAISGSSSEGPMGGLTGGFGFENLGLGGGLQRRGMRQRMLNTSPGSHRGPIQCQNLHGNSIQTPSGWWMIDVLS